MPRDPEGRRAAGDAAATVHRALAGRVRRKSDVWPELGWALFDATLTGSIAIHWNARDTLVREISPPEADVEEMRLELCRRHLRAYGPSTVEAFAWWAGVDRADAELTWSRLPLREVEIEGERGWLSVDDLDALRAARPPRGVRLLPAEDLILFGQDVTGLFAGPGRRVSRPYADPHHPHGVVVDGRLAGAWGRKAGRVDIRLDPAVKPAVRQAIEAEALAFPVPAARTSVTIT